MRADILFAGRRATSGGGLTPASATFDLESLRLPGFHPPATRLGASRPPRHKRGEQFLKGPIPWDWLALAAGQPGKALHVGIALWRWAGIKRTGVIKLSLSCAAGELGTSRSALSRGLAALEAAELVSVKRQAGCRPEVTLLDVHHDDERSLKVDPRWTT